MASPLHLRRTTPDASAGAELPAAADAESGGKARTVLVMSRRGGESFRIGDDVQVVLLHVEGHQVKIGIQAPREVPVVRGELLDPAAKGGQPR